MALVLGEMWRAFSLEGLCIPDAVAAQSARNPHATAVESGAESLSYGELDRRSNLMARYLRFLGIGRDDLVGLWLPRSFDLVVAALASWKAGAAFLPVDPSSPPARLAFMLKDAQVPVLVTTVGAAQRLPHVESQIVTIADGLGEALGVESPDPGEIFSGGLAYVIYTSGSTGTPKGVEITHAGLSNLINWHQQAFSVTAGERAGHLAGLGFDAAQWELWPYLAAGAAVCLADDVTRNSPELLRDWLVAQRITISFVPTVLVEHMLSLEWPPETALRFLLTGGDALHHYPPEGLPFVVINNYGPTECTVVATSGPVIPSLGRGAPPSIGKPIANTQIYLLDEQLNEVGAGTPGEIYIGGAGLAQGYRNCPALTSEKFIRNPSSDQPGDRLFKTGDLGQTLRDGQIAFLGRMDDQIKIRGYRIEPQEIVVAINRLPGIRDSLVVAREDPAGDKRLVAYLAVHPEFRLKYSELRELLRAEFPEYMLPAAFVLLEEFPLTAHGKVDRRSLPEPGPHNTVVDEDFVQHRNRETGSENCRRPAQTGGRKDRAMNPRGASLSLCQRLDPEILADPYPFYKRLREQAPVYWDPYLHAWVVSRYTDVVTVFHHFSAARMPASEQLIAMGLSELTPIAELVVRQMIFMDPPAHTRLRSLCAAAFNSRQSGAPADTHSGNRRPPDRHRAFPWPHGCDCGFGQSSAGSGDGRNHGCRRRGNVEELVLGLHGYAWQLPTQSRRDHRNAKNRSGHDGLLPGADSGAAPTSHRRRATHPAERGK